MRLFSIISICLLGLITNIVYASESENPNRIPNLEKQLDERSLINPSYIVGQYWFRQLNNSRGLIQFPPAYDYLKHTKGKKLPHTDLLHKHIEMGLLNSTQSDAFVIPGNHLYLYSDILIMLDNEEKMLALLAHELAHLDLKHYERQSQNNSQEQTKALLLVGAGIAAALAGADVDASSAIWFGGFANLSANSLSYSRNQEQEADRLGRLYLAKAGVDDSAMSQLFNEFFKAASGRPTLEFLSTHPIAENRLTDAFSTDTRQSILQQNDQSDFEYFRATLLTYRATLLNTPKIFLTTELTTLELQHFALTLLALLNNDIDTASGNVTLLDDDNEFAAYLKVKVLIANQQTAQAIKLIRQKLALNPENITYLALLSELTKNAQIKITQQELHQYEIDQLLLARAKAAESAQNLPLSLAYNAEIQFSKGREKEALAALNRAHLLANEHDKRIIAKMQEKMNLVIERQKTIGIDNLK